MSDGRRPTRVPSPTGRPLPPASRPRLLSQEWGQEGTVYGELGDKGVGPPTRPRIGEPSTVISNPPRTNVGVHLLY